ncbi:hypothetical protein B0H10DRAFT_2240636 [Mycena sp. CBHHK59/15]|nr:hypothetical protein B0H10DRAFT_2240636 [Mycena sp. CBHHK59/15]
MSLTHRHLLHQHGAAQPNNTAYDPGCFPLQTSTIVNSTDCSYLDNSNTGCGMMDPVADSYGVVFTAAQGSVFISFLTAHMDIMHLHLDLSVSAWFELLPNALPHLHELHCSCDLATAMLACLSDAPHLLEMLKGMRLAGPTTSMDQHFIELSGWSEMEDI